MQAASKPINEMTRQELMSYLAEHPGECQEGEEVFEELLRRPPSSEEVALAAQFNEWLQKNTVGSGLVTDVADGGSGLVTDVADGGSGLITDVADG